MQEGRAEARPYINRRRALTGHGARMIDSKNAMNDSPISERPNMERMKRNLSRRNALKLLGATGGGLALASWTNGGRVLAQVPNGAKQLESFTGPGANPHWNSVGPYVTGPQKAPLILLTDRPVQLETRRNYFRSEAARKFYRAGSEPALEFGRAICYGAAEGAADPADRPAGTTGNAAELFPDSVYAE